MASRFATGNGWCGESISVARMSQSGPAADRLAPANLLFIATNPALEGEELRRCGGTVQVNDLAIRSIHANSIHSFLARRPQHLWRKR